jgi:hypothetical protein
MAWCVMARPASARLKVNPPIGEKPALRWLRLDEIGVDYAYQRSLEAPNSQSLIRKIATFWDWSLCQPLTVAKRPGGALMMVDGQHRHAAAKLRRDIEALPCVVVAYPNAGDEAAAFVALNQQRRPLTRIDLFRAALAAEDNSCRQIVTALEKAGLSLARHSNYTAWRPGDVSNIGGIQNVWKAHGPAVVEPALQALSLAFRGAVLRYAGTIFPGIAGFLVINSAARGGEQFERLVATLRKHDQAGWRRLIMRRAGETGERRDKAGRGVIADAFADARDCPPPAAKCDKAPLTFEQQLARVERGEVGIAPAFHPSRPAPDQTLGGVGSSLE